MKKILLLAIMLFAFHLGGFAQIKVKVDKRIELTGVVFRLAGISEYAEDKTSEYSRDVDGYFEKYKTHSLIKYLQEMNRESSLEDMVRSPFYLDIEKGRVYSDVACSAELEEKWTAGSWTEYVELLDDFYRKSRFEKFYLSQLPFYEEQAAAVNRSLEHVDSDWFRSFFGKYEEPTVYITPMNAFNNYDISHVPEVDGFGLMLGVAYSNFYPQEVFLHELCRRHTDFSVNYFSRVEGAMNDIFGNGDLVDRFVMNGNDNPESVFCEWLADLCVAMYVKDHDSEQGACYFISRLESFQGYKWMYRSIDLMDNFTADRTAYPYFEDFMPRICEFMNYLTVADNWRNVMKEGMEAPYVVDVYPIIGSSLQDYKNVKEVHIVFSQPMNVNARGFREIFPVDDIIFDTANSYWKDSVTFIIPLFKDAEISNKAYGFCLAKDAFQSQKYGTPIKHFFNVFYSSKAE